MGDEFDDTSVDAGSDVDTSSDCDESFDDSSMDAGDEAIEDSDSEGLDDGSDYDCDSSAGCDTDESVDEGESCEATDEGIAELPEDEEVSEDTDEPVDENSEAADDGAEELPEDEEASGDTDEPVDENSEAGEDGAQELPEDGESTEGVDESVNKHGSGSLQFGNNDVPEYNPDKTDLQNAQDDVDFAKDQMDEYKNAVESGDIEANPETERQLHNSLDYANTHLEDIKNGQAYSYDRPSDYWASPEGREISGDIHSFAIDKAIGEIGDDPTGSVSNASKDFGRVYGENYGNQAVGKAADISQDLMRNAHNQYDTPGDKYMQDHFMRDANGLPITAAEGAGKSFDENSEATDEGAEELPEGEEASEDTDEPVDKNSEATDDKAEDLPDQKNIPDDASNHAEKDKLNNVDQKISPDKANEIKDRIRESQQQRADHPSGYKDFDQGKTNILTSEPAKLSSKNFDRLAEARGLNPEEASNLKYSMSEYQKPDSSLSDADHHPNKIPNEYATTRHILEPEQAYSYNNGIPKDGYEYASSGIYQTPEMQTSMNKPEQEVAQENLALPKSNDARVRSDTTLNPVLNNGKQHNVIEGTAAPQNTEGADEIFKANDGIDRYGGGKQIITDGGYGSGAVTEGAQHNIGDVNTDLNNPHLFDNHPAGEYGYTNAPDGKSGFGQLDNSQKGIRDANAQRMAGGSDRRPDDDGGHYIANIFNGDSGSKNLDPQNRNLNRGEWKAMENNQNSMLNEGNKVFTNNRSTKIDGSDRPDSYDAYTIVERPDGSREAFPYHFKNESSKK